MTEQVRELELREVAGSCRQVLDRVGQAVVGKREPLTLVLAGILAGGHVLLEDYPGLGKTLAARSFAQTLGLAFRRVQFTPDLLPSDVTGSFIYDQSERSFVFRSGPLFAGLLLADEINRTPPKTQAALLEAMQEGQATVEGAPSRCPAVPRHRDREPDRVRRHLPAAGGPAGPVPAADLLRLPGPDEEWSGAAAPDGTPPGGHTLDSVTDTNGLRRCSARSRR